MAAHCYNLTHCCGCLLLQPNSSSRLLVATTQLIVAAACNNPARSILLPRLLATTAHHNPTCRSRCRNQAKDGVAAAWYASLSQPAFVPPAWHPPPPGRFLATQLVATCHRGCSPPQSPQPNSSPLVAIATSPQLPYLTSSHDSL
ncbi:hypothetical protein NL676_012157 [Syzygium grande]|nr:hypothetical protein NL676_012157 [Syzygium grande]